MQFVVPSSSPNEETFSLALIILPLIWLSILQRRGARWVFVAVNLVSLLVVAGAWWAGQPPHELTILSYGLAIPSLALLFTPAANAWLAASSRNVAAKKAASGQGELDIWAELGPYALVALAMQGVALATDGHTSAYGLLFVWWIFIGTFAWQHWRQPKRRAPDTVPCPFTVGQKVYYRPPPSVSDWSAMHGLVPGHRYEIADINHGNGAAYLSIKDRVMNDLGVHWTEFSVT